MIELRDSLTDSSGKPRTETEDPTNVWCLLDRGKWNLAITFEKTATRLFLKITAVNRSISQ